MPRWSSLRCIAALALGASFWLPRVHGLMTPAPAARGSLASSIVEGQLREVEGVPPERRAMSALNGTNPEWELLGRGFLALSLADMALASPSLVPRHLAALDQLIDETQRAEQAGGHFRYLLPYARRGPMDRSLFVDSQIALMLAARLHVAPHEEHQRELARRVALMQKAMEGAPVLSSESYPDECWMYDNTGALAAMKLWDSLSGEDHSAFARRWLQVARSRLVDRETGLLVSSFRRSGEVLDGPEGSSLWVSAHNLLLVDPAFAREQYERGRTLLKKDVFGFVLAREWPGWSYRPDVDSGPVVPVLEASPGSSGLMLVGAAAFGDQSSLDGLIASLELAAFPMTSNGVRQYTAAGQVGNAAILRALTFGPLWKRAWRAS